MHPFCPQAGIYVLNTEDTPTLDYYGDTLFDIYALYQDGPFNEAIWEENIFQQELSDEEIESLKQIKIENLKDFIPSLESC